MQCVWPLSFNESEEEWCIVSEVKDWIWFSKRQVPYFQDETEPKQFPAEYIKYVPKSEYDELKVEVDRLRSKVGIATYVLKQYSQLKPGDRGVGGSIAQVALERMEEVK